MAPVPRDVIPRQLEAPAEASDAELLRAIGEGSEPAFEELRHRYRRAVERACRSIVPSDLEDCAQEVFVRVWRKARLFDRDRGSAPAWLLTLARRTAVNVSKARRPPVVADPPDHGGSIDPLEIDRLWLEAALARLPERQRLVIELAYFADLSQARIAAELGVPLGSVKSWTRRGLNRLAVLLGDDAR